MKAKFQSYTYMCVCVCALYSRFVVYSRPVAIKVELKNTQGGGDTITTLAPEKFELNFRFIIFERISVTDSISMLLPEPMLTQISVAIWCH